MTRSTNITLFAFLARVESGYEYQVPRVIYQQPNQHLNLAQAGQAFNSQQSVSYSSNQGNYNFIRHHSNGLYLQNQNKLNYNNPLFNGMKNIQSGFVVPKPQQPNSVPVEPGKPIVTKHIYFHVPPPDEERLIQAPPKVNSKKTYNIVFIKLPSQKPNYYVNANGAPINPYAVAADRTLIYVLVKNPEDYLKAPKASTPNHEVFYVKYKGNAANTVSQITGGMSQQNSELSLRPGLINGQ